jgi:Co/Zn/Cd efflux system component
MIMSIGLIISALVIFFVGNPNGYTEDVTEWNAWHLFDPIATYVFSITALLSTLPVIKNAFYLFMEAAPSQINMNQLYKKFKAIPGVVLLKRVNVW